MARPNRPSAPPFTEKPLLMSACCTDQTASPVEPTAGSVDALRAETCASPRNFAVLSSRVPVALNPATFCSDFSAERVAFEYAPVTPPLMLKPRAMIASCKRTTSGPLSPNWGSCATVTETTGAAATDVVLMVVAAIPNVADNAPIAMTLRRRLLFMMCSLDLLAV